MRGRISSSRQGGCRARNTSLSAIDKLERTSPEENEKKLTALGFSPTRLTVHRVGPPDGGIAGILENLGARGLRDFVKVIITSFAGWLLHRHSIRGIRCKGEFRAIAAAALRQSDQTHQRRQSEPARVGFGMATWCYWNYSSARALPKFDANVDVFI